MKIQLAQPLRHEWWMLRDMKTENWRSACLPTSNSYVSCQMSSPASCIHFQAFCGSSQKNGPDLHSVKNGKTSCLRVIWMTLNARTWYSWRMRHFTHGKERKDASFCLSNPLYLRFAYSMMITRRDLISPRMVPTNTYLSVPSSSGNLITIILLLLVRVNIYSASSLSQSYTRGPSQP